MSHITKLIINILMKITHKSEMGQEQCGFVQNTGTRIAIFMFRANNIKSKRLITIFHRIYNSVL